MKAHQIRHLGLQFVRRCVQVAAVGLVFALVFLSLYAHYRAARALEDPQVTAGWKGRVLAAIDARVAQMEGAQEFLDGNKGTLWSLRVAGVDLTDPLAAAEMMAASKTVHGPLLISILLPVVATLLLGRVFCSWICPGGLLFEVAGKLRKLLRFAELPLAEVKFSHRNKYVLLMVGLSVVAVMGLPIFALVYPPAVLSRLAHAWIFGTGLTGLTVLILLIIVFELFVSPRWWCRTMCPGGALYALIGWPRPLRVKLVPSRCTACGECQPVCAPGIDPVTQSDGIECDNCGVCVRRCPERALVYTIGLPGRASRTLPQRAAEREPRGAGGEANARKNRSRKLPVITSLLLLGLLPAPAEAHHILGLPHYSYKDNYPQAPTLEYPASTGPYDVLLTCYPADPIPPGEPVNLAVYIRNRNTEKAYARPVTMRVLQTFTFGRNRVIVPPTVVQPLEIPHKLSATFPEDGEYVVELTLAVEGAAETIPFMVTVGEPTATASVLAAVGSGLALFVIVVRAVKIKRARRAKAAAASTPALE